MTDPDTLDATVTGWCDSVQVMFEIRGGRLNRWLQAPMDLRRAQPLVGRTEEEWRPFADRAATLAATLLRS